MCNDSTRPGMTAAEEMPPETRQAAAPPLTRLALALGSIAACVLAVPVLAQPLLRCHIEQGGQLQRLEVRPGSNPYLFKPVDVQGHFRFLAVVIGGEHEVDYVKLHTYYKKGPQFVLMHQVKYPAPAIAREDNAGSLTGVARLVSPVLGRELQYSCALIESGR